jgi:GDP-L-fucose synthase
MKHQILISGGSGMVGQALLQKIPSGIFVSSQEYNLINYEQTYKMFEKYKPSCVIHLAAKVGGIKANMDYMGDFYKDNIMINTNVLESARKCGVEKVISLMSTCVYPDKVTYPLTEEQVHDGPPHSSNYAYAYAKRMLDIQSRAYRNQYGCDFITAIPNNLYGENDNFHLEDGHVIPALLRKIWEAKINNNSFVECWGDGSPLREFTYSEDLARILLFLIENYDKASPINIGNTEEYSIKEVVELLCKFLKYDGEIVWNTDKPAGQFRKPSSNQKLLDLGWKKEWYTPFKKGLKKTCEWFIMNYPNVRGVK